MGNSVGKPAPDGKYSFYKIHFVENYSAYEGDAEDIQFAKIKFWDVAGKEYVPTAVENPKGRNPEGEGSEKLLSGSLWHDLDFKKNKGSDLVFSFSEPWLLATYEIWRVGEERAENDPYSWRIYGSNDKKGWVELGEGVSKVELSYGDKQKDSKPQTIDTFEVKRAIAVLEAEEEKEGPVGKFLKFRFTATSGKGQYLQLSLIKFKSGDADVVPKAVRDPEEEDNSSPDGEKTDKLLDPSLDTKWLNHHIRYKKYVELIYEFESNVLVTSYSIFTANDYPERDPSSWTLQVSKNGSKWKDLDARETIPAKSERHTDLGPFTTKAGSA